MNQPNIKFGLLQGKTPTPSKDSTSRSKQRNCEEFRKSENISPRLHLNLKLDKENDNETVIEIPGAESGIQSVQSPYKI